MVSVDLVKAQTQIQLTSDFNLLYHEKGSRQQWDIWFLENQVDAKLKINNIPLFLSVQQKKEYLSFTNHKENQTFPLVSAFTEISGGIRYNWNKLEIEPLGSVTFGNKTYRLGGGLQVKYEIMSGFKILGAATIRQVAYQHSWKVEDIHPEFQQWAKVAELKTGINWVWDSGSLFATHQIGKSMVLGQNQTFTEEGDYRSQTSTLEVISAIGHTFGVQADIKFYRGEGFPVWSYKEFPFSSFESGSSSKHHVDLKVFHQFDQNWKPFMGFTYREMSLKAGGILQSHPFTPAIFSLIGDYYFFSIDQIIRIPGINLGSEYLSNGSWSAGFSLGWQRARPKLKIKTWEPLFLLFGRKNEKTTPFSYQYVDLIPVKANYSIKFHEITLSCELSQQIPVHAVKNPKKPSTVGGGGSSNPSPGSSSSSSDKSVWGGTELKLTVLYNL
ncbi:MAG: hypothetical protein J0L62_03715 [Bacteroidetes bacterium]|nr:hypothetical protein [Bacteroidota bacterium]